MGVDVKALQHVALDVDDLDAALRFYALLGFDPIPRPDFGFPGAGDTDAHPAEAGLWEQFISRENLAEALRRVERNAGAAGIDGIGRTELRR